MTTQRTIPRAVILKKNELPWTEFKPIILHLDSCSSTMYYYMYMYSCSEIQWIYLFKRDYKLLWECKYISYSLYVVIRQFGSGGLPHRTHNLRSSLSRFPPATWTWLCIVNYVIHCTLTSVCSGMYMYCPVTSKLKLLFGVCNTIAVSLLFSGHESIWVLYRNHFSSHVV